MLRIVAAELLEYADDLEAVQNPEDVQWRWGTLTVEAQAAVYDQMNQDGTLT
jgi:hypothetical protein